MSSNQPEGAISTCVEKKQVTVASLIEVLAEKNNLLAGHLLDLAEFANLLSIKITGNRTIDRDELMALLDSEVDEGGDEKVDERGDEGGDETKTSPSLDGLLRDYERRLVIVDSVAKQLVRRSIARL